MTRDRIKITCATLFITGAGMVPSLQNYLGYSLLVFSALAFSITYYWRPHFLNHFSWLPAKWIKKIDVTMNGRKLKTLEQLFKEDFSKLLKQEITLSLDINQSSFSVQFIEYLDFETNAKFFGLFIKSSPFTFKIIEKFQEVQEIYDSSIRKSFDEIRISSKNLSDYKYTNSPELLHTGRFYIYHETELTLQEKAKLESQYNEKKLSLILRNQDHAIISMYIENV